jgi:hypothetical protein
VSSGPVEEPRAAAAPVATRASHVDTRFDAACARCRDALSETPELHYLGHYTDGAYDFSYDRLDEHFPQPDRTEYERIGVQVTNAVRGLDRGLQEVKTGALIRTVVHARHGLVICDSARPNEHVVGFSHAAGALATEGAALSLLPAVREVDRAIAGLVTTLRQQVSLGSQNPGAWASAKPEEAALPLVDTVAVAPHVTGSAGDRVSTLMRDRVHPSDLHLVALCRGARIEFWADQLDHPQLGPYFQEISVSERRLFYENMCHTLPMTVRKLGRMTASAIGGKVERVVLDVEQGAIYYYRIGPGEYLVGVTLDQRQVARSDDKVAEIALACRSESPVTPTGG